MNDFSGLFNSDYGPSSRSIRTSNSLNGSFPNDRDPIFSSSAKFSGNSPVEAFNLDSMYGGTSDAGAKLSDSVAVQISQRLRGCRKSAQSPISDIVGQIKEWCRGLSENNGVLRPKLGDAKGSARGGEGSAKGNPVGALSGQNSQVLIV
ncbi:hypothetical protein M0R45_008226 [Rubus argutus]|uniref:Uncharacterized protein n=1 Tax=Rubus argutus TaxID=59490 RepID=A0AAW1Y061_RUBAR